MIRVQQAPLSVMRDFDLDERAFAPNISCALVVDCLDLTDVDQILRYQGDRSTVCLRIWLAIIVEALSRYDIADMVLARPKEGAKVFSSRIFESEPFRLKDLVTQPDRGFYFSSILSICKAEDELDFLNRASLLVGFGEDKSTIICDADFGLSVTNRLNRESYIHQPDYKPGENS